MLVQTAVGFIARDKLRINDVYEEHDNARVHATEWFLGDELVRRDVEVNILRGLSIGAEQAEM